MKKLSAAIFLFMGLIVGNVEASELLNNGRKIAQPIQSKSAYKSLQVRRFVLAGYSDADYYNFINKVAREIGSDNQKIVSVIWSDKNEGIRIQKALIEK